MKAKTLKALRKSIAHWKRLATGKRHTGEDVGPFHCALCEMFFHEEDCRGCPVRERTGKSTCQDSPYHDAWEAAELTSLDSASFKKKAAIELAFLKSLLPKGKK